MDSVPSAQKVVIAQSVSRVHLFGDSSLTASGGRHADLGQQEALPDWAQRLSALQQ